MKRFLTIAATILLAAPLLMSTKCGGWAPPPEERCDEDCEMECIVWVNYVDEQGATIKFNEGIYPDFSGVRTSSWRVVGSVETLQAHIYECHGYPWGEVLKNRAHGWFAAAPDYDPSMHPNIKGVLLTSLADPRVKTLKDSIEVTLHYETPKRGYVTQIKINDQVKWDRNSFEEGKVPDHIVIDFFLDKVRL